jgi:hypothetical protein
LENFNVRFVESGCRLVYVRNDVGRLRAISLRSVLRPEQGKPIEAESLRMNASDRQKAPRNRIASHAMEALGVTAAATG